PRPPAPGRPSRARAGRPARPRRSRPAGADAARSEPRQERRAEPGDIAHFRVGRFAPAARLLGGVAAGAEEDGAHPEQPGWDDDVGDAVADHHALLGPHARVVAGAQEEADVWLEAVRAADLAAVDVAHDAGRPGPPEQGGALVGGQADLQPAFL